MKIILGTENQPTTVDWCSSEDFYSGEIGVSNESPCKYYLVLDDQMLCLTDNKKYENYYTEFKLRKLHKGERLSVTFEGE